MSHSFNKANSTAAHSIETSTTTASTKQNDGLSASAPAFVPRPVVTEQRSQQHGRGHKGPRGGGRQDRGGLSQAINSSRDSFGQQHQQQHSGRGRGRHRPQSHRPQQEQRQPGAQLNSQPQQYEQYHDASNADNTTHAAGSSPDRSGSRSAAVANRGRAVAANHLLNFQYDSGRSLRGGRGGGGRSSGTPSSASSARRRYPAPRPQRYDKQKFLQANFRFLVSSTLDRRQFESDADRMFDWDDVILVDMMSATPIQCPISLESPPMCPQITPCGHVYSFGSIMHHLMNHGGEQLRRSAPCPLCYQPVVARELRLVQVRQVPPAPGVGSTVTFQLLRRPRNTIIPTAVASAASAGKPAASAQATAEGAADKTATSPSPGSTPTSKWRSEAAAKSPGASNTPAQAAAVAVSAITADLKTPLSDNLFAKFATCTDPRPLWRASAQQLGQQLALVLSQGGMEAEIEAPALFAAADSLANRARRFAEHQANELTQRGVPGAVVGAAPVSDGAAAAGLGWPIWLKEDPQAAGHDAEQLVRDAFTLALDGSKAALVAKGHQQQVRQRIQQEFPELASTTPPRAAVRPPATAASPPSAAAGGRANPGAASPMGSQPQQQTAHVQEPPQQQRQHSLAWSEEQDTEGQSATELHFDHAFSEDEDVQLQHQEDGEGTNSSRPTTAAAGPADEETGTSSAAHSATGAGKPAADSAQVLGTSPGTAHILGSSPVMSRVDAANQTGDYYMYQSSDGQWVFLHPLNLRCLLHAFGSYGACPPTVTGKLLEVEDIVQDDTSRRRWKFLGHLPLNGTFRLAEVQLLEPTLSPEQLAPFAEELSAREKRRKRRADAAKRESRREAAAAAAAEKARQGPTAAELRAMPKLGASQGPSAAGDGVDMGIDFTGMTAEQIDEALAAQVMHDSAAAAGSSPGGVSFAKMTKLGFAASGPALGVAASPGGLSEEGLVPAVAAPPAALKGAWGARSSSGQSAAARLGSQGSSSKQAPGWGAGSSSASSSTAAQPAVLLGKSSWAAGTSAGSKAGDATEGASSSSGPAGNWLVLGSGGPGKDVGTAVVGAPAVGEGELGPSGESSNGAAPVASKKGKKEKKSVMLFTTGAQRKY